MASSYYYFVAALPMLQFDSDPSFSCEEFLNACQQHLSLKDYELLSQVMAGDFAISSGGENGGLQLRGRNRVYDQVLAFEINLRNEIVTVRCERVSRDPLKYYRGERVFESFVSELAHLAVKADNPWETEKILDQGRWSFLDDCVNGHFFSLENVIVYALKLRILQRWKDIKSDKGKEVFQELITMEIERE